jgi:hypothetical protein
MRDRIEEAVLLLISPNLADKKDCVDDQTRNEHTEENDAEDERNYLPPVKDDPADIQDDRQGNETSPERDEECDGFGAARDAHDVLVYARASDCHIGGTIKKTREPTNLAWIAKNGSIAAGYRQGRNCRGNFRIDRRVPLFAMRRRRKLVALDVPRQADRL